MADRNFAIARKCSIDDIEKLIHDDLKDVSRTDIEYEYENLITRQKNSGIIESKSMVINCKCFILLKSWLSEISNDELVNPLLSCPSDIHICMCFLPTAGSKYCKSRKHICNCYARRIRKLFSCEPCKALIHIIK